MKWEGNRQSENVEDARNGGGGGGGMGGGIGGMRVGGRGVGLGTIVIALLAGWAFGINPMTVLSLLSGGGMPAPTQQSSPATAPPAGDREAAFVSTVLADTEDVWREQFQKMGAQYRAPKLRLFRGVEPTACGTGQSAMGPFYCPADQKVYIDLGFFETMRTRMGATGEFAHAYVIAHEVGHHVQSLLGITEKIDGMRGRVSEAQQNELSVRLELQADCFAGVWAFHANKARQILEQGDVEKALNAAAQIGDDTLQKKARGTAMPETFTHGTSQQRVTWLTRGLTSGDVRQCDTFGARNL